MNRSWTFVCHRLSGKFSKYPKISSQDRDLHGTVEQILDVLVPEMAKQLVEVPETISPDKIQQRDCGADR